MASFFIKNWMKARRLGAGSYGTVYLAINYTLPSTSLAAVKSCEFQRSASTMKEAKFLKELRGNPYIVECFGEDVSVEYGRVVYNMLMEYAPGGTLVDLISAYTVDENYVMPESHAAYYAYMLLSGLSHIHRQGLVHCDIKPCNILVFPTPDGLPQLKLADFGLAKYVWEEDSVSRLRRHRGTRVYASPESIELGIHKTATDVWSLGCSILQMMTGRPLIRTLEEMWSLIIEMVVGPSETISEIGKDFLRKCFIVNPECRWSVLELLDHPFIVQNIKGLPPVRENIHFQHNPFGNGDRWIATRGLFSTPIIPQLYPFMSQLSTEGKIAYQQFPKGCNSQAVGGCFSVLHGVAFINNPL